MPSDNATPPPEQPTTTVHVAETAVGPSPVIPGAIGLGLGILLGIGIMFLFSGGGGQQAGEDDLVLTLKAPVMAEGALVATGKDVSLTDRQLAIMLSRVPLEQLKAAQEQPNGVIRLVREQMAARAILRQSLSDEWPLKPRAQARARQAAERTMMDAYLRVMSTPKRDFPDRAKLEKAIDDNPALLKGAQEVNLAQIFLAFPKDSSAEDRLKIREQAIEIYKKVTADGADFGAVAGLHSDHKDTAVKGGETGWVNEEEIVPELRAVIAQIEEGKISNPIQTNQGIHIVKKVDVRPGPDRPREEVIKQLRTAVRKKAREVKRKAIIKDLADRDTVQIDRPAVRKVIASVIKERSEAED